MQIMCIDPGVTTGYCVADDRVIYEVGTCKSLREVYRQLEYATEPFYTDKPIGTIVIEKFSRGQTLTEEQEFTIKVVGVVELFAENNPNLTLVYQMPYERKTFLKDAKLYVGRYACEAFEKPHITDAVAHWLAFKSKSK